MALINSVNGKDILFVSPAFHGYENVVVSTLLSLGAKSVYYKQSVHFQSDLRFGFRYHNLKAFIKNPHQKSNWSKVFLHEIAGRNFDILLVFENLCFSKWFLAELKKSCPKIKMILFLWDALSDYQSHFRDYFHLFDKVYSFDKKDAEKYKLSYLPNFYIEIPPFNKVEKKYDLSLIVSMTAETTGFRGEIVPVLLRECERKGIHYFFYVRGVYEKRRFVKWYRKYIHKDKFEKQLELCEKCGVLHKEALSLGDYYSVVSSSKTMIDLHYRNRQGYTMNVMNAIGNGIKLITTNKCIIEEPFYDPSMICVIDEKKPVLDKSFFESRTVQIDLSYLRIDNWLSHICGEND